MLNLVGIFEVMKGSRLNRSRKDRRALDRTEAPQEDNHFSSGNLHGSDHPKVPAEIGGGLGINEGFVQQQSSPRTIMDAATSSKHSKQSCNTPYETVQKKPNQWGRLRTLVLSPKRRLQKQREPKKHVGADAPVHSEFDRKECTHSSPLASGGGVPSFDIGHSAQNTTNMVQTNPIRSEDHDGAAQISQSAGKESISTRIRSLRFLNGVVPKIRIKPVVDSFIEKRNEAASPGGGSEQARKSHQTESKPEIREQLPSRSSLAQDNGNLHELENPPLKASQVLHVSVAGDDISIWSNNQNDPKDERGVSFGQYHESKEAAGDTPLISGSWGRMTGEAFSARLNNRDGSEKNGEVEKALKMKSLEDEREKNIFRNIEEDLKPGPRLQEAGKHEDSSENTRSPLQTSSMRSFGQARTKKNNSNESDLESPWGVKGELESGDSFGTDQGTRSFRVNLNSFASRMNVGRTRKRSIQTESDSSSLEESSDDVEDIEHEANDGKQADGEKIEMFRDAFVDYTLKSLQSNNNKTFASRRTGRKSTLAIFKD